MKRDIKKVLILCAYFYPGFRSGGPQQTVANIIDAFSDTVDIYLLTQNYDQGMAEPYEGINTGVWLPYGKAKIKYLSKKEFRYIGIKKEYEKFDVIFSCGMFEINTIAILLIDQLTKNQKKIYIAPMGVFSEKAIKSKRIKKVLFLQLCKITGVFRKIIWSFTSEIELEDARNCLGKDSINKYIIAEDMPKKVSFETNRQLMRLNCKRPKQLKVVFISRICSKKNLDFCFDVLSEKFKGKIIFDIYGIIEDERYWAICRQKSERLPECICANYRGSLRPEHVISTMLKYDIFFFPTKGENYGHVIYEALSAGCIPLITDTTPWMDLDILQVGNVIRYGDTLSFRNRISEYLNMEDCEIKEYKETAISYAEKKYESSRNHSGYRKIFCTYESG